MSYAVQPDGMQSRVAQDEFSGAARCRVALTCDPEVFANCCACSAQNIEWRKSHSGEYSRAQFAVDPGRHVRSHKLKLTFVGDRVREPIIYTLAKRFDVVTNIRRADIREGSGWVILEATATAQNFTDAFRYLDEMGVRVDDLENYVVE